MIEPNNGQAPTTSADKYTGAIILRTRPHTYKRVVRLLSEGVPAIRIARDCKVTERSVAAIKKREAEAITERKNSLAGLMSNIAEIGGANVERKIGKASVRDAIIGTGVAIDKMLALTGQTPSVQIANVILPTEAEREERRDRQMGARKYPSLCRSIKEPRAREPLRSSPEQLQRIEKMSAREAYRIWEQ
jgi:hypothetical protein